MVTVRAGEFAKNFGMYREIAQREPVAVTNHDRVTGYFLSAVEFAEYQRLKALEGRSLAVEDLPEDVMSALTSASMDPRHSELNPLMDE